MLKGFFFFPLLSKKKKKVKKRETTLSVYGIQLYMNRTGILCLFSLFPSNFHYCLLNVSTGANT